ncbi:MAG: 4Fe-4S dicluster domain-containing protein [Peptococcaceae bacterium]|nr:4Fe-4S dicluster domain-containing protein [Peptococcaceae bacterium]MDH7526364.1 4Fe-4S dicluster domain-containing protein [Peptococcaceae bacterium]
MLSITKKAVIDLDKCNGCRTCYRVCPTFAISMENKKPVIDYAKCYGCTNCHQRCPQYAVTMEPLEEPIEVGMDVNRFDQDKIWDICIKAKYSPDMIVCICSNTRAGEVAAAILDGARTPAEVTLKTGAGIGCKIACPRPIYRLLQAAGIEPPDPADGYQWRGPTATLWNLNPEVIEKYGSRYFFEEDRKFLDDILEAKLKERNKNA